MAACRFKVMGTFDRPLQTATVKIDRATQTLSIRVLRQHKVRSLPLAAVASMLYHRLVRMEVAERTAAKRKRKVARRFA